MEFMTEDVNVPRRKEKYKRKTVLSKLANTNEDQLQLAKDLERQNLDSSYGTSGLKNLSLASSSMQHRDHVGYSSRRLTPNSDLEGKGEKRSREFNRDSSESDSEMRGHSVSKRHSLSRVSSDDEDDEEADFRETRNLSSRRYHTSSFKTSNNLEQNVNFSNNAMNNESESASSVDDLRKVPRPHHPNHRKANEHRDDGERRDDDDDNDGEQMDLVPELTSNHSSKYSSLNPLAAASTDFKIRPGFPHPMSLEMPFSDAGASDKSYASTTSALSLITTEKTRKRSFLVGSMSAASSLLGSDTLERFFPERKLRIFVGTWNMCEMKTVPSVVDDFLLPETSEYVQDAYVVGTQETAANRHEWELKLQETLGPEYVMFHSSLYGTLHLAIFLRRDLVWFCSVSEEANVTTRPGPSSVKTKGAVAVCFTFFGTSFLFINAHFTAHDGRSQDRVEDFRKIIAGLSLPKIVGNKSYGTANNDNVSSRFECVFWLGDLNTRLERDRIHLESVIAGLQPDSAPTPRNFDVETEAMKGAEAISFDELLKHDELKRLRDEALAFENFQEGRIQFLPTYKYDIGTDQLDTSKKNRIPSYTDRILFRSRHKNGISCLLYQSASKIRDSDHKPVFGLYEVSLRPGMDNMPLSGGQFNREVWIEGNKRRAMKMSQPTNSKSNSTVCSVM